MIKNILVPLTGFESDLSALEASYLLGHPVSAKIEAIRIEPEPMDIILAAALRQFSTKMSNQELVLSLQQDAMARTRNAKVTFEQFYKRHFSTHAFGSAASGVTASWRHITGNPVQTTTAEGRFSDLLVLARAPEDGEFSTDSIANIVVGCGRPTLLVPNIELTVIGHTVAIAWKEKAEAARALTAAMPLLARAKNIIILAVEENSNDQEQGTKSAKRIAEKLACHGFAVQTYGLKAEPHLAAQTLVQKAKDLGADLVVAGAYSHGRMRELVFGGFTRSVLNSCDLPVYLLH